MTSLIRGKVARFTKVDRCGTPIPGPRAVIVTEGLISVAMTTALVEGTTITVELANGNRCINDVPEPKFSNMVSAISLCGVNPWLVNFLTGQDTWDGATPGIPTGFTIGDDVDVTTERFAMELWSGTSDDVCDEDGDIGFGYFLLPKNAKGQLGDVTWQNDAINFTVNGAQTKGGNQWGVGPFDNVTVDDGGDPSPLLRPLGSRKHFLSDIVYAPPPTVPEDGLPFALGTEATGATAGAPGAPTPSGSWFPDTVAGMTGITASPATAWTTGQYVSLDNGEPVHWSGSAWVAGVA